MAQLEQKTLHFVCSVPLDMALASRPNRKRIRVVRAGHGGPILALRDTCLAHSHACNTNDDED